MGGLVSSQMDWQRLPLAPLYADVWAYGLTVDMLINNVKARERALLSSNV